MEKSSEKPEKIFRPSRGAFLWIGLVIAFSAITSVILLVTDPGSWVAIAFYVFTIFGIGGAIELKKTTLILYPSSLYFSSEFKKRRIAKNEIDRVTWEKGCDPAIQLKDGSWVKIPTVGSTNQGICQSIRAWLKREPNA
ncbi:MAG: hypothetical protein AAFX93_17575 [Verrucomicrobiota bacterium]